MDQTTERKMRTITLTDRPPVQIVEDDWPVIGKVSGDSFSGHDYNRYQQALVQGECDTYLMRVRHHADGRSLVYAVLNGSTPWTGTEDRKEGELLPAGSDIIAAIRRVGADCEIPDTTIRDCIASLPAERI